MKQVDDLGWKGVYNPKNCYPRSPFLPSSPPTPDEVRKQAKFGSESAVWDWNTLRKITERHTNGHILISKISTAGLLFFSSSVEVVILQACSLEQMSMPCSNWSFHLRTGLSERVYSFHDMVECGLLFGIDFNANHSSIFCPQLLDRKLLDTEIYIFGRHLNRAKLRCATWLWFSLTHPFG